MKRMAWMTLALLPVLFAAGAAKAQEGSGPVGNRVASTVKAQLTRYAKNMVAAADLMPADKFSFKPTPEMNTFGHLTLHIAQSNNFLCSKISGTAAPDVKLTDTHAEEKVVAALKASFAYCTTDLANVDDSTRCDLLTLLAP